MQYSKTYFAVPPGSTIKEQIEDRGMTQQELAERMNVSAKHVSKLIRGQVALTEPIAAKLELVLGVSAKFWMNLENIYRINLAKVEDENNMEADTKLLKSFPYKFLETHKWIGEGAKSQIEKVTNLRKFFGVVQLSLIDKNGIRPDIVFRKLRTTEKSDLAALCWLRKAQIDSEYYELPNFNRDRLENISKDLKKYSRRDFSEIESTLKEKLAQCGVALILLPSVDGSGLQGATFINRNKIVLGLTDRCKDTDRIWFSLYHELGHIINGDIFSKNKTNEDFEILADKFAADSLINPNNYSDFIEDNNFTEQAISEFAQKEQIHPGIVVGRLQKDGFLKFSEHNNLKSQYSFD